MNNPTRRAALVQIGAVTLTTAVGCTRERPAHAAPKVDEMSQRFPTVYLPHGGGPWPFVDVGFGSPRAFAKLRSYLERLSMAPPSTPRALLVVSAHWEAALPTVQSAAHPKMLYDYSGFPPESYTLQWPAPGAPEIAAEVRDLLEKVGIKSAADAQRGFDHGTFVVTKVAWPQAEVPTFQLSLQRGLDPKTHLAIGRALEPLRDKGVFIIGSGMSYHNMRGFFQAMRGPAPQVRDASKAFDDWLAQGMVQDASTRATRLIEWEKAPSARACHPREEHLLPLHVIAGAAGNDKGIIPYREELMGTHVCAVQFG